MSDIRYQILTDIPDEYILLSRFPHEFEESFIDFVAKQYRATKITRLSDGVVVYEQPKADK